jgi:hypothetical protein
MTRRDDAADRAILSGIGLSGIGLSGIGLSGIGLSGIGLSGIGPPPRPEACAP